MVSLLVASKQLSLQHVFAAVDWSTVSADSFTGPIGKKLKGTVSEWKVAKFKSIPHLKFPILQYFLDYPV